MKKFALAILLFAPTLAFAQELANLGRLLNSVGDLVRMALPIVVALALLAFFWGLVKFIFAQGNEDAKADAKKIMLWGLVALFVMVAVWGLVAWIASALGVTPIQNPDVIPTVPIP